MVVFLPLYVLFGVLHRKGKKGISIRLFIVLITILIGLIATEITIYFRSDKFIIKNPWLLHEEGLEMKDPDLRFTRKPNIDWSGRLHGDLAILNFDRDPYARKVRYQTDAQGFRNSKVVEDPELIVLGDSYTEAGNVNEEDTYASRLSKKTGLSMRNLGVSGYTTPEELLVFLKHAEHTNPKVLVLQVAESNDIHEAAEYYGWVKAGKPKYELLPIEGTRKDAWRATSPTYALYQFFFPLKLNEHRFEGTQTDSNGKKYLVRFLQMPNRWMSPKDNVGWQVMTGSMIRFSEICAQRKIRLIVIMIPDKINVLGDVVDLKPSSRELYESAYKLKPEEKLSAHLRLLSMNLRFEFIDMTEKLKRGAQRGEIVYLPMDTHLAPAGHEIVASEVARKIESK